MKIILNLLTSRMDDRIVYYGIAAVISCVLLFNLFLWGYFNLFIVLISIVCGYFMFKYVYKKPDQINNVHFQNVYNKMKMNSCNNCINCNSINVHLKCKDQTPWKKLLIPEEIDSAIDKLLSKIIEVYIESWYKNISNDTNLILEFKQVIRFATSVILKRLLKLNFENILLYKILPICLSHIQHCKLMNNGKTFPYHHAISNRKVEILYLQKISTNLLPFITREDDQQCMIFFTLFRELLSLWVLLPISDKICTPDNINIFFKLSKHSIFSQNTISNVKKVEFLSKFINNDQNCNMQLEMRSIFKDATILSSFKKFLKQNNAGHLLQFLLDVEQFNKHMLRPEISTQELDLLYRDAWDIFSVYFSSHSPDCINFDPELVNQLRKVLSKDVIKLQNSKPLYQAYEYAYSILEKSYWIDFHNSDEYFSWMYGLRNDSETIASQDSLIKNKNKIASKLGQKFNRIKCTFKSSPIYDGHIDSLSSENFEDFGEDLSVDSEIISCDRDLSSWKVLDITSTMKLEYGSNSNNQSLVFFITVEAIEDGVMKQWCVDRRLTDFYTLKSKLIEFHGETLGVQLPPRKIILQKNENNDLYMDFLNQLLQKPELRRSDLLHMFLTSIDNFEDSESAIGRLLRKSMPISLRRERGQNLEPFISTFLTSIENKFKQRYEWKDLNKNVPKKNMKTNENSIFGNNLNITNAQNLTLSEDLNIFIGGPIDCIIFFGVHIYKLSNAVFRLLLALQSIFGHVLDCIIQHYIRIRVTGSFSPATISNLITLLERLLFPSEVLQNTEKNDISVEYLKLLNNSILLRFYMCLFKCTQNSVMNKQLLYRILDALLEEIFPELKTQMNIT